MSLTEDDLDRISDKVELKMRDYFDSHRKDEHEPLEEKISSIKRGIGKHQRFQYMIHALQGTGTAIIAALKGHP